MWGAKDCEKNTLQCSSSALPRRSFSRLEPKWLSMKFKTGSPASRTPPQLNVQSGQHECCGPQPESCRPLSWTLKRCCEKRMRPQKRVVPRPAMRGGWKGVRPREPGGARRTQAPCQETSKNRHHVEPRVKLYSPREESFPIPLKYIDVTRTTHTNLDVKQEKRIDDNWDIDGSRDLSDPWTGFTQFTLLEEKAPDGYMWSGGRLKRKQLTSRPDHSWPEL